MDGAAENRSVFKRLCTHTAEDALPEVTLLENTWIKKDFPLAFRHPHPDLSHIMIFVMGDMSHIVKKLVSALDMSSSTYSKRNLRVYLNEDYASLRIHIGLGGLYKTWLKARNGKVSSICTECFSRDMCIKNANTQMCLHLCTRILSKSQAKMVENYGEGSILAIVRLRRNVNTFIDIMSARREKECHKINCTTRPHLEDLYSSSIVSSLPVVSSSIGCLF